MKALFLHAPAGKLARRWAEETLRKAELPTEVGFYTLNDEGSLERAPELTSDEQDEIIASGGTVTISYTRDKKPTAVNSWAKSFPDAVEQLGYQPGTPERDAAELLELMANVSWYISEGNAKQAAASAFYAGMLWQSRKDDEDSTVGQKVRKGGLKGAKMTTDDDAHMQWWATDRKLKREGITSQRERARRIAEAKGAKYNTVRSALRSLEKSGG